MEKELSREDKQTKQRNVSLKDFSLLLNDGSQQIIETLRSYKNT